MQDQNYIADNIYDLDCNDAIRLGDFVVMFDNWLMTGPGIPGDFVPDEIINFLDFIVSRDNLLLYIPCTWQALRRENIVFAEVSILQRTSRKFEEMTRVLADENG